MYPSLPHPSLSCGNPHTAGPAERCRDRTLRTSAICPALEPKLGGATILSTNPEDPTERGRIWTLPFILACTVSFFTSIVFYLSLTMISLYAVDRFRSNDSTAGFAASSFILSAVGARFSTGPLIAAFGRRRIVITGVLVYVMVSALYLVADTIDALIALRLVHGFAFGGVTTAITSGVMTILPPRRRGEGAGYYGVPSTLATAVGPLLAVLLVEASGYDALFVGSVIASSGALAAVLFLRLPEGRAVHSDLHQGHRVKLSDFFDMAVLPVATVVGLGGAAYSGVLTFLAPYAQEAEARWSVGVFYLVYSAVVLAGRMTLGRLQDARGDNAVMYPVLTSFTLGMVLLGCAESAWMLVVSAVFVGFWFGMLIHTMQVIAVKLAPPARINTAVATVYVLLDAGTGTAPLLLGLLIPLVGYSGMYLSLGGVLVLALVLYALVHGRHRGGAESQ
jgi:predicted MFS family arabinose efflux permease